jgi:hypothetical protein
MDRYLHENYDVALEGFKTMDQCRAEISKALKEMDKLKTSAFGQVKLNKADILEQTLSYFDQQKHDGSLDELETLRGVFGWAQNTIQVQMEALTASVEERRNIYSDIFNNDELKKRPYELRATFHHDGKSGTGHYWAYIWVEPDHNSSLESPEGSDTGGWFRFCDSQVTAATEDQILSEGATLFSMIYVDANVPKYSRSEIQELIPEELQVKRIPIICIQNN